MRSFIFSKTPMRGPGIAHGSLIKVYELINNEPRFIAKRLIDVLRMKGYHDDAFHILVDKVTGLIPGDVPMCDDGYHTPETQKLINLYEV